jgi:DNA-binding MarR family transcriptional regulator
VKDLKKIESIDERYRIFGILFLLSTKLETIGNSFLGELTTKQWFFMLTLTNFFDTPPTLSQLATQMGTSHQNAKQLAIKLQDKGFLSIEKDVQDNRILRLVVTEKIQEYVSMRQDRDHYFIEEFFKVLTKNEIKSLDESLLKLLDNIQDMHENLL